MNIKDHINKILRSTCAYFTVIIIVYTFIVMFLNVDADEILLEGTRVIFFLVFSALIALANRIFSISSIGWWRFLIHYVVTMLACYICLILPITPSPSTTVVGITIFSVIYFAVCGLIALMRARYKKRMLREEKYEKRFSK